MRVPYAPWLPDMADLDASVATVALNVLPGSNCYLPMPTFSRMAATPLSETPLGAFLARLTDGSFTLFVGTASKLLRYNSATRAFDDVSKGGGYTATDDPGWSFTQYGSTLIAVDKNTNPQAFNLSGGTNFADLAGSPPKARYVATVGYFVMLGGLLDFPTAVQWSAFDDPTSWPVGTNQGDQQILPDGGFVTGLTGLDYGFIFQEDSIRQIVYAPGSPFTFEINRIQEGRGCIAPQSITRIGDQVFYLGEDGFKMIGAGGVTHIGREKVDRWFYDNVQVNYLWRVRGCADPIAQRVFWSFYSNSNSFGTDINDLTLCYDIALDRWALSDKPVSYIFPGSVPSWTLEGLDSVFTLGIDDVTATPSFDDRLWIGGRPIFAGFDAQYYFGLFSSINREATIETGTFQFNSPKRAFVRRVAPLDETVDGSIRVSTRERYPDTETWRATATVTSTGWAPTRASGRFHRIRRTIPAGSTWTKAIGVEIDAVPEGER